MNRVLILFSLLLTLVPAGARDTEIVVNPGRELGRIKPMNCVNNGPVGNGFYNKAARIPYARTHDTSYWLSYGGEHTVDISAIFPDFSKDENDPASYDFKVTDNYLKSLIDAGTEVFYRLGQRIEHTVKKYNVYPPEDFGKWARVCEHIIRHYNEGWADGFHWNIKYWAIWNEPDLDAGNKGLPLMWGGTEEQFYDLYKTTALHLKKCFPDLMIGGRMLGTPGCGAMSGPLYAAAEALEECIRLGRKRVVDRLFGIVHLVRRASSRHLRIPDSRVLPALEFIRRSVQDGVGISVEDVAREVQLPLRTLHRRFLKAVGHTLGHEIREMRFEQAKRQLALPGSSIDSVAVFCGYDSASTIRKLFAQRLGSSPSRWRASTCR